MLFNTIKNFILSKLQFKLVSPNQKIDVLTVDVEGLDLEVLESNDWNQFTSKVVVEAHDFKLEQMHEHPLYNLLRSNNYSLKSVVKFSLIFTHNTI